MNDLNDLLDRGQRPSPGRRRRSPTTSPGRARRSAAGAAARPRSRPARSCAVGVVAGVVGADAARPSSAEGPAARGRDQQDERQLLRRRRERRPLHVRQAAARAGRSRAPTRRASRSPRSASPTRSRCSFVGKLVIMFDQNPLVRRAPPSTTAATSTARASGDHNTVCGPHPAGEPEGVVSVQYPAPPAGTWDHDRVPGRRPGRRGRAAGPRLAAGAHPAGRRPDRPGPEVPGPAAHPRRTLRVIQARSVRQVGGTPPSGGEPGRLAVQPHGSAAGRRTPRPGPGGRSSEGCSRSTDQ